MRRTTVVLPEPDPPATPITSGIPGTLFVAKRRAGIQARGPPRGHEPGHEAYRRQDRDGNPDRREVVGAQSKQERSGGASRDQREDGTRHETSSGQERG